MWRAASSARRRNKLQLRDMAFVGGPGDLAQCPGRLWEHAFSNDSAKPLEKDSEAVLDGPLERRGLHKKKVKSIDLVSKERRNHTPVKA